MDQVAGRAADACRDREQRNDQRDTDRDAGRGESGADCTPHQVSPDEPDPGHGAIKPLWTRSSTFVAFSAQSRAPFGGTLTAGGGWTISPPKMEIRALPSHKTCCRHTGTLRR